MSTGVLSAGLRFEKPTIANLQTGEHSTNLTCKQRIQIVENTDTGDESLENLINNEPEKPSDDIISSARPDNNNPK